MQGWVTQVLLPYAERCISTYQLRSDAHIVLMLDVWSVHKGEPFRRFLRTHHPRIHLVFIPANCTSKLQVADVALQRPFKASIRRRFDTFAAEKLRSQLAAGAAIGLKDSFGMTIIKPLLLQWSVESWRELQQRKNIIADGWSKCLLSLYDVHDPNKRIEAMREVAEQALDPAPEPEGEEPDEDPDGSECDSDADEQLILSTDDERDELNVALPVAQGSRRSTRTRNAPAAAAGSYFLNSQQIALTEDSEA